MCHASHVATETENQNFYIISNNCSCKYNTYIGNINFLLSYTIKDECWDT